MDTYPISEEQRTHFWEQGYVKLEQVLDPHEVLELRAVALDLLSQRFDPRIEVSQVDPEYEKIFVQKVNLWRVDERMRKWVLHPRLGSIAAQLTGVPMRLWHDHLLTKMPEQSKPTAWHQDIPYWPHSVGNQLGIWIPLQDVDERNGCLGFVPGSHKLGVLPSHDLHGHVNALDFIPESMRTPVWVPLKAGDCTVHHGLTLHGAGANTSDQPRIALSIFYMPDGTLYNGRPHVVTDGEGFEVDQPLAGELFPLVGKP